MSSEIIHKLARHVTGTCLPHETFLYWAAGSAVHSSDIIIFLPSKFSLKQSQHDGK